MQNRLPAIARLEFGPRLEPLRAALENAFWGSPALFLNWLALELKADCSAFERTSITKDLEELQEFFAQQKQPEQRAGQMALL